MMIDLLRSGEAQVVYHDGAGLDRVLAPRPFLTASSPSGVAVTEVSPDDHPHHLGLSLALPDVNGVSFWGGNTFVRGHGPALLDNHGVQRVDEREISEGRIAERLSWLDPKGAVLLDEERVITARAADEGWELVWTTRLTAVAGSVGFGSPQTNGRVGAFYGGLFWRTPFADARVRTADGEGIAAAHGSDSPWLAVDTPAASLVAASTTRMPWFVRHRGYVGFAPAVAVTGRRTLAAGESLHLDLAVAVRDRPAPHPAEIADGLLAGVGDAV
ncbi:oxidoreductase [Microbacterium protaetiae]|uniref:Oxidoreductase n=1 Tax=Microbacterium protaetiae TaxID=2509458 RepID=A0A4P6EAC1_9MICO|nr:PmoA family protein [Microbacterium protaetiae]QAY59082.1 oxidoreductase [Microbacterium protaetiae]